MKIKSNEDPRINNEMFVIGTQIYVRLRRVSGRVIDAMYLSQDTEYAMHVIEQALKTDDLELHQYAFRLRVLVESVVGPSQRHVEQVKTMQPAVPTTTEPTAEEIYNAQVPHHYIGALR